MCMKNNRLTVALGWTALSLSVYFYGCKPKEPEVILPDTSALTKVSMPTVPTTQPTVATSTVGAIAPSAASTNAITSIVGTTVNQAVEQAQTVTATILGTSGNAAQINQGFTDAVVANFANTGTLPAALETQINSIVNNPAFAPYLPLITNPTVNGVAVSSIKQEVASNESILDVPEAFATAATSNEACFAAAKLVFDQKLAEITTSRDQQLAAVNASFTTRQTAINAAAASCSTSTTQTRNTRLADAQAARTAALAAVNTLLTSNRINATFAANLRVFINANLVSTVRGILALDAREKSRCERVRTADLASATTVRNNDSAAINNAFSTARNTLSTANEAAVQVCHNQGSGN